MIITPPPGCAKGLLVRDWQVGAEAPLFREYVTPRSLAENDEIVRDRAEKGLSLAGRDDVESVNYQNGIGSCAWDASEGAFKLCAKRSGYGWRNCNPWTGYRLVTNQDNGSHILQNLKVFQATGLVPDDLFPRYDSAGRIVNHWRAVPPPEIQAESVNFRIGEAYEVHPDTYQQEIATGLVDGWAAVIGWDGHAECLCDYLGNGKIDVLGSYGANWADNGCHVEHLRSINMGYGAFMVRTVVDR